MNDVVISKAAYLNDLRCHIQQLAIDFHEYAETLNTHEWQEFEELSGMEPFDAQGFAEDLKVLLVNGSF